MRSEITGKPKTEIVQTAIETWRKKLLIIFNNKPDSQTWPAPPKHQKTH